eukprot:3810450-Rhodomonas_salina.2
MFAALLEGILSAGRFINWSRILVFRVPGYVFACTYPDSYYHSPGYSPTMVTLKSRVKVYGAWPSVPYY